MFVCLFIACLPNSNAGSVSFVCSSMAHSRHSVKICQVNEEERVGEVGKALPPALGNCYYVDVLTGPLLEGRHNLLLAGKSA